MDVSIISFLPAYPSIDLKKDNLFDLFPQGFYQSIYNKKEFHQLKSIPDQERINDGKFHPQPHQIFASRYSSPETPYDRQLIFHSMGFGKTGLAILTAENAIGRGFVGGVIAVPSQKFFRVFMTEIVKITGTKYFPPKYEDLTPEELERAIRKNIRKIYRFLTFEAFANSLKKDELMDKSSISQALRNEYSNRVIIIDEAHNLRIKPDKKETSEVYSAFHLLLQSVINCKILIMTATPFKDRWNEIASLVNLMLPLDKQFVTGNEFDREFSNNGITITDVDKIKDRLRGLITTLRSVPSSVKKEFIGEFIGNLKVFKVDVSKMSDFQAEGYLQAYRKDTEAGAKEGIYDSSRQAVNFVFPDGSYGVEGFKKYTKPLQKGGIKAPKGTRTFPIEELTPELYKHLRGKDQEETLNNISKFSSKYAKTIRNLLKQTEEKAGNSYIYNWYVEGSGCIIFSRLLEMFGYQRSINGIENTKGKRYVLLTNKTIDEQGKIVANVQKTFNDPKNARGEYIQIIVGSQTSGEGLSFYNVENIEVHTPFFNYSPIDQAIARGIRYGSHDEIIKIYQEEKKDFTVKIHHCVAVPPNIEESIDLQMYQISQDKDQRIKLGERMLKEIAYDCGTNRLVNMRGIDGSRECEYLNCEYKCEGLQNLEVKSPDFSTFNYYYSETEEKDIISRLRILYRKSVSLTLTEILEGLNTYQPFVVLKTLKKMIDQSDPIYNKYGFKTYLREHNDTYFLVDTMEKPSSSLASYYTLAPAVKDTIDLDTYVENLQYHQAESLLEKIYQESQDPEGKFTQKILPLLNRLSINIKESLLEMVIDAEEKKSPLNQRFRLWILDIFKSHIRVLNDGRIVSTLIEGVVMCRFSLEDWRDCSDDETIVNQIEKQKVEVVKDLEDNPYGYYAIINTLLLEGKDGWKHGFWIRDIEKAKLQEGADRRKKIRGEKCSIGSLKIGKMASIAYELGIDIANGADEKMNTLSIISSLKKDNFVTINYEILEEPELRRLFRLFKGKAVNLCNSLLRWFQEKKLVQYTTAVSMK